MTRSTEHEPPAVGQASASDETWGASDRRLLEVGRTVRRALVARNGVEAGCEAAAEAMVWAVEHRDRLDSIDHLASYLYRVGQSSLHRQRRCNVDCRCVSTPGTAAAKQFYANYVFAIIGRNDLVLALPE